MAKHYEALQRAEEERRRKVTGVESPIPAAVSFEDAASPRVAKAKSAGLLSRFFSSRSETGVEEATDANKRRISLLPRCREQCGKTPF